MGGGGGGWVWVGGGGGCGVVFFFNDTATTEIYTLSLHDALPIFEEVTGVFGSQSGNGYGDDIVGANVARYEGDDEGRITAILIRIRKRDGDGIDLSQEEDRKSTRLNSSHVRTPRMPSSA